MVNKEFIAALNFLAAERGLEMETVLGIIESAIATAYKKEYGTKDQRYEAKIDENSGQSQIWLVMEVKASADEIENPEAEIDQAGAAMYDSTLQPGDLLKIDVTPMDAEYSRIAAQAAKNVIISRISEAEKEKIYHTFKEREDELVSAKVTKIDANKVILDVEGSMILLPRSGQMIGEKYYQGQVLKLYLERVRRTTRGPELLISRTHPRFVVKLFEQEIPEVKSGLVEIKGISRKPGIRSKVAVATSDPNVDPVGACIGQRGMRIATVLNELGFEKVDVIEWSENPEQYLRNALEPAEIVHIDFIPKRRRAIVYVADDQRAIAVGKKGQNVDLASMLTMWTIDLEDATKIGQLEEVEKEKVSALELRSQVSSGFLTTGMRVRTLDDLGLSERAMERMAEAGIITLDDLRKVDEEWLSQVKGISPQQARDIVSVLAITGGDAVNAGAAE